MNIVKETEKRKVKEKTNLFYVKSIINKSMKKHYYPYNPKLS